MRPRLLTSPLLISRYSYHASLKLYVIVLKSIIMWGNIGVRVGAPVKGCEYVN